jgi:hypothetical protein
MLHMYYILYVTYAQLYNIIYIYSYIYIFIFIYRYKGIVQRSFLAQTPRNLQQCNAAKCLRISKSCTRDLWAWGPIQWMRCVGASACEIFDYLEPTRAPILHGEKHFLRINKRQEPSKEGSSSAFHVYCILEKSLKLHLVKGTIWYVKPIPIDNPPGGLMTAR